MEKRYIIINIAICLILFISNTIYNELKERKIVDDYNEYIKQGSFHSVIDSIYSERAVTVIRLQQNVEIKILPKHELDKYIPYYFEKIATKGDSINKKANVDTLDLYHKGEKISFEIKYMSR